MLTVLLLAGAEKLINMAINSDAITQAGLSPLAGKVLRLNMAKPELQLDVIFNHEHLRFEPVRTDNLFEPHADMDMDSRQHAAIEMGRIGHSQPDCSISVANPAELLNLMRGAEGNLPISGDYKVLMQLNQLIAGFDPNVADKLEPFIGKSIASQLQLIIAQLKIGLAPSAARAFDDVSTWANNAAGMTTVDASDKAQADDLKQQLLKLRADVEREEAKLAHLKAEQDKL